MSSVSRWAQPYDGFERERSDLTAQKEFGESLTVQAHAEDADLNVLMRRFGVTGKMPDNVRVPTYGDFTGITDFRSAIEAVRAAQASFMEIPAEVRSMFENDPQMFLDFCEDPGNVAALRELGIRSKYESVAGGSVDRRADQASRGDAAAAAAGARVDGESVGRGASDSGKAAGAAVVAK